MNFIQKRMQERKLQEEARKEELFKAKCCPSILYLEAKITELKEFLDYLSINRKDVSLCEIDGLMHTIKEIDMYYCGFLRDLKRYQSPKTFTCVNADKLDYMLKKKKEYRHAFERLYINFGRVSKGYNFPRRNEILGLMRKAFDFDSSKYYSNDDQFVLMR